MANRREVGSKRWYTVPNGQEYPSVTTILQVINKPALVPWAAKMEREMVIEASSQLYLDCPLTPKMSAASWKMSLTKRLGTLKASQKELTKAGEIGSQAHALIEWNLRAGLMQSPDPSPHVTDKATWAFMAWEDWKKSVNLKPIFVEQMVFSDTYGYAGTMDLLAEVNGVLTVLDWKTGKAIYPESYLQNAAYRYALREMGHGNPVQGLIVRLPKLETDPAFEVKECLPEKDCMEIFLNAKKLWEWNQKNDTWKPEQNVVETLSKSLAQAAQ